MLPLALVWLMAALAIDLNVDWRGGEALWYLPAVWFGFRSGSRRMALLVAVWTTMVIVLGAGPWRHPFPGTIEWLLRGFGCAAVWGTLWLGMGRLRLHDELGRTLESLERLQSENELLRRQVQSSSSELTASLLSSAAQKEAAEQALRDSEALYHSLVDHLPLSVLRKNAGFEYTFVSRRFVEFSGKQPAEILGKTDFDLFPVDLAKKYREGDEQVIATGRMLDDVEGFRKPDGEERCIQVLKTPIRDAQQRIVGTQVMLWDVTDRERAEAALEKSAHELEVRNAALRKSEDDIRRQSDLLELILRSIADGVVVADEEGRFLVWNPAAERIIGLGATDKPTESWPNVYGLYSSDKITPYPAADLPLTRAIRGEVVADVEIYLRNDHRPQGAYLSVTGAPLRDGSGILRGGVVVFRDVTRQRAADEALRQSEERARQIVDTAYDPFVAIDEAGQIIDWNSQAAITFGWPRQEVLGTSLADRIIPPAQRDAHDRGLRTFLETGVGPLLNQRLEVTALHRDGREFPVELTIWPLKTSVGFQFQAFVHDITDRKRAEEEIRSKNQDLETLLYVTSHDLREPLRAIENFSRLVRDRYADKLDEKGQDFLDRVVNGAQRLDRLLDDVLTLSRVQRTTQPESDVDAGEIVDDVLRQLEPRIRDTQAQVRVLETLPHLRADRRWATQAVQNLISNALKYTREGFPPEVEITGYDGPEGVGLIVADRGMGVPEAYSERIFGLFQRAVSRNIEGTGAGLAIVRRVAERHGGRAWVRPRDGGGSEFIITFGPGAAA
jgi:PAS domain S-box-containing protein